MDKPGTPVSPSSRHQSLMRPSGRDSGDELADGDTFDNEAGIGPSGGTTVMAAAFTGNASSVGGIDNGRQSAQQIARRIDRFVKTRTADQITLPLQMAGNGNGGSSTHSGGSSDVPEQQRGWRSPRGEPYRPLGNPELSLKFTPRLANTAALSPRFAKNGDGAITTANGKETGRNSIATLASETGVSTSAKRPTSRSVNIATMFPPDLLKRSPEDRQVKLAQRLHDSIAQYSPDKISRRLRKARNRPRTQHQTNSDSSRVAAHTSFASARMLRDAIDECSTRVRLAKSGIGVFDGTQKVDSVDLTALGREYHTARERYHATLDNRKGASMRSIKTQSQEYELNEDANDLTTQPTRSAGGDAESIYLPYTTRRPQQSPHKNLPSYAEFRGKVRDERAPVRPLLSARAPPNSESLNARGRAADGSSLRSPVSRQGRAGSMIVSDGQSNEKSVAFSPSGPSGPMKGSLLAISPRSQHNGTNGQFHSGSEVSVIQTHSSDAKSSSAVAFADLSSPRLHSVVRLQTTVNAIEDVKEEQSAVLTSTLIALNQDRRDCLALKFKNFSIDQHIDSDVRKMRVASEMERSCVMEQNMNTDRWYHELLRQMVARETPLHPAESLLIQGIRRISSGGQPFHANHLYRLILILHPDDVSVAEVQQLLTFLKKAISIPTAEWDDFFKAHHLSEPIETFKQKEMKKKKRSVHRAKLYAVVTMKQALHHTGIPIQSSSKPSTPSG